MKQGELCNTNSTSYKFGDICIKAFLCVTLMISAFHNLLSIPVMLHHFMRQSPDPVYFVARVYKNTISELETAILGASVKEGEVCLSESLVKFAFQ
jgi:hypothetical protein